MIVNMTTLQIQALDLLLAVGAPLEPGTAELRLFQNDFVPNKDSVLADFTEATFDGYAAPTLTFANAYIGPDNTVKLTAPSELFVPTGSTTPNIIYGWYIVANGTDVFSSNRFDTEVPLTGPTTGLVAQPEIPWLL